MEEKKRITIKEWADEDKPREKLLAQGKKSLSNAELLGILINSGSAEKCAVDLAKEILLRNGNSLSALSRLEIKNLTKVKGIGEARAITIIAALELGYRMLGEDMDRKERVIRSSKDLFDYLANELIDLNEEEFWCVYLNAKGKVLGEECISHGGLTETLVDPRKIFSKALDLKAIGIAFAHNHPSGSLLPSDKDKKLTRNLADAGKLLHIKAVEHIVVGITASGRPDYYSFFDNGLL